MWTIQQDELYKIMVNFNNFATLKKQYLYLNGGKTNGYTD